jgi:Protein of unknown function (DUF2842)
VKAINASGADVHPRHAAVLCYAVLGLAWIVPVMPLIRWMEKPGPGT